MRGARDGAAMMRLWSCACLVTLVSACSFGAGSAYVGQWRARDQVELDACLEDDAGRCTERRRVVNHLAARRFWGLHLALPAVGASFASIAGQPQTKFRMELSGEFLKGKGNLALGGRISGVFEPGDRSLVSAPMLTAMGHLGLAPRFAVYGGLGMSPYTRLQTYVGDVPQGPALVSHLAFRALAGAQVVLAQTHGETYVSLSLEADRLQVDFDEIDYSSWGLVSHLGVFF
jgi:hypothetical protein